MRIHLIATGGAIMHQLAIALHLKGNDITGSDDVINEPAKSNLAKHGLLPSKTGFFAENITPNIDAVVLGMHAKFDNPELARAMELGLKVYSFPEYVYENSQDKKRVVVAGSHGKTSITSMIMHVLRCQNMDFDYLVGSSVNGFELSVKLTDAPLIILEGDEYLASALTREPKFIYYKAHTAILSGIEWDHINVFKTEEDYFAQFKKLVNSMESGGKLYYFDQPKIAETVVGVRPDISTTPYRSQEYEIKNEQFSIYSEGKTYVFQFFGKHNMENMEAARLVCSDLGVAAADFYSAMEQFKGAGRRLETAVKDNDRIVYKDFAHSPSKLRATVLAVKQKHPNRKIVACYEMHTFSSLSEEFLPHYSGTFSDIAYPIIYLDQQVVSQKGNNVFSHQQIKDGFGREDISYFTNKEDLEGFLNFLSKENPVYLMMSSGTFSGLDLTNIGKADENIPSNNPQINTTTTQKSENITLSENSYHFIDSEIESVNLDDLKKMLTLYVVSGLTMGFGALIFYILYQQNQKLKPFIEKFLKIELVLTALALAAFFSFTFIFFFTPLILFGVLIINLFYVFNEGNSLIQNQIRKYKQTIYA